eukprot:TRINITY_DN3811_c0_g2_i2.p1 TRINITY_DN3811_c0_g2~~TRINITY_DN3811_c0_g2_i2.p1  ORF type:complete len:399 (+),score=121.16 TRINITY_DN3811_c0_g2_i2:24-1199(+)
MIRRPPRSTHCISSAASDVYKRQILSLSSSTGEDFSSEVTVTMEVNPYFDYSSYSLATYDIDDEMLRIDWTKDIIFENRNGKRIVTFNTTEVGIYAIVYYPRVSPDNYYGFSDCGWPCEYPDEFMFVFFAVIYVTLVISVTFWCIAIQTEQKLIDQQKKLTDKPQDRKHLEDEEVKVEEREDELEGEEEKKEEDHKDVSFSNHNEDIKSQLSEANIDSKDPDDSMEFKDSGVGVASNLMRQLTSIVIPPTISRIVQREASEEHKEVFKEEKLEDIHEDEFNLEDDKGGDDIQSANNILEDEKYYTPEVKKESDIDDDGNIVTEKDQQDQKEPENPVEELKDEVGEKDVEEKKEEDLNEMADIEDDPSSSRNQDKPSAKGLLSPLSIDKKDK